VAAFKIAVAFRISGYNALYVALSDYVQAPLVTADAKLVNVLKNTPHDVRWLGDV
jgi:predicted nucleic acid-binding protein